MILNQEDNEEGGLFMGLHVPSLLLGLWEIQAATTDLHKPEITSK